MSWEMQLDGKMLEELYLWLDSLPLSRPKKRIERDFSDAILIAEIISYYLPGLVDLHNYGSANSLEHKKSNWAILNKKVLSHFGLDLPDVIITGLSNGKPGLVEVLLFNLRLKIDEELELRGKQQQQPLQLRHTSLSNITTNSKNTSTKISSNQSTNKDVTLLDFEEVKQQYLEQEEQIEVLQAKLRRLEHVLQLKDMRINELSHNLNDDRTARSNRSNKK